jgi:polyferredoxin
MKRGGKIYKVNLNRKLQKMNLNQFRLLEQKQEYQSKMIKRIFYILFDILILVSFSLSLYFTYFQDYTKTILFLVIGTMLLIFFILEGDIKK